MHLAIKNSSEEIDLLLENSESISSPSFTCFFSLDIVLLFKVSPTKLGENVADHVSFFVSSRTQALLLFCCVSAHISGNMNQSLWHRK